MIMRAMCVRGAGLAAVVVLLGTGCASWNWNPMVSTRPPDPEQVEAVREAQARTRDDYARALREVVLADIAAAPREPEDARLVERDPYHFKEYARYPLGEEGVAFDIVATDSVTTPYIGTATTPKIRFVTRLERDEDQAEADTNFLRETGEETLSYEVRSGAWKRTGSLFVATTVEEQVNGEWVEVQEPEDTPLEQDGGAWGWFRGFWSNLTGR